MLDSKVPDMTSATLSSTAAAQTLDLGDVEDPTSKASLTVAKYVVPTATNYAAGDKIPAVENATARFGHAVLTGENEAEITQNIKHFYEILQVKDIEGNDLLTRLYPAH